MAPQGFLVVRNDDNSHRITPIIIAGFCFAGAVGLVTIVWLGFRFCKTRLQPCRNTSLDPVFLTVRGLADDAGSDRKITELLPADIQAVKGHMFSRAQFDAVVMPAKAITRPNMTKEEIVKYHAQAGNLPRPFSSFSFALAEEGRGGSQPSRLSTASFATPARNSFLGAVSGSNRFSTVSRISSPDRTTKLKVRQLFEPVLPDEPLLSMGEHVTAIRYFDDGWVIVGRPSLMNSGDIELGAVPAWCFLKHVKGLRTERPARTDSLGISVQVNQPNQSLRENVMSWSNF